MNPVSDNNHTPKRLVVLGGGESGVGAAILGKDLGWDVFVSDMGPIKPHYAKMLADEGIPFEQNGHTPELILNADEVVKSPGIPPTAPLVKQLAAQGTPILSEIELAGRFTRSKMVCITGSNGKTTTTLLTYHILRDAGVDVGLAGNVGKSLALQVARDPHDVYVIELSSFQLENMYTFKANVAVILNITPDHMDRYDYKMENYVAAKFRILQNQTPTDAFIYWEDDPVIASQLARLDAEHGARRFPFSEERHSSATAAWIEPGDDTLHIAPDSLTMPRAELSLAGLHNLYNSMAAGLASALVGEVKKEEIRHALSDFEGVEHRLEFILTDSRGVRWINDSKATNVNSCWYALESMPADKSVVLILGGKDKGNDYSEIAPLVKERVKKIVAMGLHNEKIIDFFTPLGVEVVSTDTLDKAVQACVDASEAGDTVLLSPCCASFDLFNSYEDRGERFKAAVKKIK